LKSADGHSIWQVHAILPYSLTSSTKPKIQVVSSGGASNELSSSFVQDSGISLFQADTAVPLPAASALNEDGRVNSPAKSRETRIEAGPVRNWRRRYDPGERRR
jgi:uncharacterized protein (TIGR03437 family)